MSKIVDKLRDRAYSTKAGDDLCEEAAALIEALEWRDKTRVNVIARLTDEVERLRTLATHTTQSEGSVPSESTLTTRLRQTRADMIGTDDENHYWDCHDAAAEIDRLREAIRSLADQDATLSVQGGNVTVTMDATLTDEEREAIEWYAGYGREGLHAATLRNLLERTK